MALVRFTNPNLLESFFNNDWLDLIGSNINENDMTLPSVNIKETNESFEVEVAAPGFDKDEFKIELDNNILNISSEKKEENEVKEGEQYTKREFNYQSFSRSFTLPETVEADKISAKYDNGILKISIPKKEEAKTKPVKQIAIS